MYFFIKTLNVIFRKSHIEYQSLVAALVSISSHWLTIDSTS